MIRLPSEETLGFLARSLPPAPARILEVGCADGSVALALAERGYDVSTLDEGIEAPGGPDAGRVRWIDAEFTAFGSEDPYDALVFSHSFHQMASASTATDHAASLLLPGGHLTDPPLLTGHPMLAALRQRFDIAPVEEAPCLYRYVCGRLDPGERGTRLARRVLDIECRPIRERDVAAAGIRVVGTLSA